MSLSETIKADLNHAVKSGNAPKKTALRDIISKVQTMQTAEGRVDCGDLTCAEYLACIVKVDNEYRQSIDAFTGKPGYETRLAQLQEERVFVMMYLPKKFNHDEISLAVNSFMSVNSFVKKDMGVVVKALNAKYPNQLDGKILATLIAQNLK